MSALPNQRGVRICGVCVLSVAHTNHAWYSGYMSSDLGDLDFAIEEDDELDIDIVDFLGQTLAQCTVDGTDDRVIILMNENYDGEEEARQRVIEFCEDNDIEIGTSESPCDIICTIALKDKTLA